MKSIVANLTTDQTPLILACSPRAGGTSDLAARLLAKGLEQAGAGARLLFLRDYQVQPCTGCQTCGPQSGHRCVLMEDDGAEELFGLMLGAPVLFFTAPIYFYHLPAMFKGFVDRSQRYYEAKAAGDPLLNSMKARQALTCLVAWRTRGERLFEGALLTLRYFLWPFNLDMGEPLCLRGLEGPHGLEADGKARARLESWAAQAWESRNG